MIPAESVESSRVETQVQLSKKLLVAVGAVVAVGTLSLTQTLHTMSVVGREYDRVVTETLPTVMALDNLRLSVLRIVASTSEYAMSAGLEGLAGDDAVGGTAAQSAAEADEISEAAALYSEALASYFDRVDRYAAGSHHIVDAFEVGGGDLIAASTAIAAAVDAGAAPEEILEAKEVLEDVERSLLALILEQTDLEWRILELRRDNIHAAIDGGLLRVLIFSVLAFAGVILMATFASRRIIAPLKQLTIATNRIAAGHFASFPEARSDDEVGVLAIAFGDMARSIRRLLQDNSRAVEAAAASEARFRDVAEASSDWIWETGPGHQLTYLSDRFAEVMGLRREEVLGQPLSSFLSVEPSESDRKAAAFDLDARLPLRDLHCRYIDLEERVRVCRLSGKPLLDASGAFLGYRGTATDITSEVNAQRKAQHLALHDGLTGLPNRLLLAERLDQNLAGMKRQKTQVGVICIDLDRFKEVNDTLGHAAGDALLIEVANRLEGAVRATDTVARLGGDEFAIVQSDAQQPVDAEVLCRRLLEALAEPYEIDGQKVYTGASIGVAIAPADGEDHDALLKHADVAMYRAKKEGRNTYRFFETGMDAELQRRKAMEADLRVAIEQGQMEMYYQPLVASDGAGVIGVEALVRWHRPGFGMVSPAEFIPLAEETGLILPLGEWILRTSCRQAMDWPELFVAINLSPMQFRHQNLVELVRTILHETGLPPSRLELEITEGVLLQDTELAVAVLDGLKETGVRIAMDDFGTGYSSLSYLQRFDFDKIKLDQSFVRALGNTANSLAIVRTVLGLGKSLGIKTTAEGVETQAQLEFLRLEGCDQMQGYFFSKPVPADAVRALVSAPAAPGSAQG